MLDKKWLLVSSIGFEISAFASIFFGHSTTFLSAFFLFHSVSAFLLSGFTFLLLPNRFKKKASFIAIFGLVFLFPLTGYIVIPVTYVVVLRKHKKTGLFSPWKSLLSEEVLMEEVTVKRREFGEGAIGSLVLAKSFKDKPKLVLLAKDFTHPVSFGLVKKALSGIDDEARLYAFSALSKTENRINDQINKLNRLLDTNLSDEQRENMLSQLSLLYWEIVYLRIADSELMEFYLDKALECILDALSINEKPDFLFIAGRIYLRKGDFEKAKFYLEKAFNRSGPTLRINLIPYLSEVYFNEGNLSLVKDLFKQLSFSIYPNVGFMKEFWLADETYR